MKNVQKRLDKITNDRHKLEYLISQKQEPIILQIRSTFLEEMYIFKIDIKITQIIKNEIVQKIIFRKKSQNHYDII